MIQHKRQPAAKTDHTCAFRITPVVCRELLFWVNPAGTVKLKHCVPWARDWGPAGRKGSCGGLSAAFLGVSLQPQAPREHFGSNCQSWQVMFLSGGCLHFLADLRWQQPACPFSGFNKCLRRLLFSRLHPLIWKEHGSLHLAGVGVEMEQDPWGPSGVGLNPCPGSIHSMGSAINSLTLSIPVCEVGATPKSHIHLESR